MESESKTLGECRWNRLHSGQPRLPMHHLPQGSYRDGPNDQGGKMVRLPKHEGYHGRHLCSFLYEHPRPQQVPSSSYDRVCRQKRRLLQSGYVAPDGRSSSFVFRLIHIYKSLNIQLTGISNTAASIRRLRLRSPNPIGGDKCPCWTTGRVRTRYPVPVRTLWMGF